MADMSWGSGLLGGVSGLLLLAVLSFARGYFEEWWRIRKRERRHGDSR